MRPAKHRSSVSPGRVKGRIPDGPQGLFVESRPGPLDHFHVDEAAVFVDGHLEQHGSLLAEFPGEPGYLGRTLEANRGPLAEPKGA